MPIWRQVKFTDANLTDAVVTGASFEETTSHGFTAAQLASTASYQTQDLRGINLSENNLSGWDLSQQNLTDANLQLTRHSPMLICTSDSHRRHRFLRHRAHRRTALFDL